jgi:hypothetical protein
VEVQMIVNRLAARLDHLVGRPRAIRIGSDAVYVEGADRAPRRCRGSWPARPGRAHAPLGWCAPAVVVDAGANVGLCTVELARHVGKEGRVYAVRAGTRTFWPSAERSARQQPRCGRSRQVAVAEPLRLDVAYVSPLDRGDHRTSLPRRGQTISRSVTSDDLLADEKRSI